MTENKMERRVSTRFEKCWTESGRGDGQGDVEKKDHQLYRRPYMMGKARGKEEEEEDTLHMDLSNSDLLMHPKTSLLELTAQFSETLSHLLDKHAPKQTKMTQPRPPSPWMSLEIILAKRRRRYLERVWRRIRSPLDRSRYTKQLHLCNRMMSKSDYRCTTEVYFLTTRLTPAICGIL